MKKILYFITTSDWGGASRYVYDLCKYEIGEGNKVYLVVGSNGELSREVRKLGIKVYIVSSVRRNISPLNDVKAILSLRRLVKKLKPDIIHLNSSKAGVIGRVACIGLKSIKVIFTVHGWAFTDGVPSLIKRKLYRLIERAVSPLTDFFICVSNFDLKIGIKNKVLTQKSKAIVIHNGSPVPEYNKRVEIPQYPIKIIMVARFSNQKDQLSVIEAVSHLPLNIYRVTFIGEGENLAKCQKRVSELRLENNIKFEGFKRNVAKYLLKSDVFVMTSFYEGLPLSIIEAMSYGLPIIASDVGGNSELVKNNVNGYLIKNRQELEEKLNYLITNPNRIINMQNKSRELYLKGFDLNDKIRETDNVYKKLLK